MLKGKGSCQGFITALAAILVVTAVGGITIYGAKNTIGKIQAQINHCHDIYVSDEEVDKCMENIKIRGAMMNAAGQAMGLVGSIPMPSGGAANLSTILEHISDAVLQAAGFAIDKFSDCPAPGGRRVSTQVQDLAQVARIDGDTCTNISNPLPADVAAPPLNGCASGIFACNNGSLICRSLVCNSRDDCGDGSDESVCNTELSCCQATNGCPGETATTCAETCCCCPYGQVCDRDNPANGCVNAL